MMIEIKNNLQYLEEEKWVMTQLLLVCGFKLGENTYQFNKYFKL